MTFKQFLVSAMLLTASVCAQAKDYNLGILPAGYTIFGNNAVSGSFMDKINFSLAGLSNGSFGVGALNFSVGGPQVLNIDGLSLTLFDGKDMSLASGRNFTVGLLDGGNYYLQIGGLANGIFGGLYAGGIEVSPVPEPDMWGLLAAGLAVFGFMARRRRSMD